MKHYLYSDNLETNIAEYEQFNREAIKSKIIEHLSTHKDDMIIHEKELSGYEKKKYAGNNILNFYQVNPKTGKASLVITKGDREYFKPLIKDVA